MFAPKLFTENLFDDWDEFLFWKGFNDIDRKLYGRRASREMLTDVREHDNHYEVIIDLPGFKKDEITIELKEGNLTVTAAKGLDKDEKDKEGTLIRQERYSGMMQRSFYVGENVKHEEIKAKFENGVLTLEIPKEETPKLPKKKTIMIEG
ncbi:MAG: Hsp20/alpha crystallin family protein [Solobacterium sp.]|nr:Hsp20/alpha crystallin family protein [Solobacterium sp.]